MTEHMGIEGVLVGLFRGYWWGIGGYWWVLAWNSGRTGLSSGPLRFPENLAGDGPGARDPCRPSASREGLRDLKKRGSRLLYITNKAGEQSTTWHCSRRADPGCTPGSGAWSPAAVPAARQRLSQGLLEFYARALASCLRNSARLPIPSVGSPGLAPSKLVTGRCGAGALAGMAATSRGPVCARLPPVSP